MARSIPRLLVTAMCAAVGVAGAGAARAAEFDAGLGRVVLDSGAAFALGFDEAADVAALAITSVDVFSDNQTELDSTAIAARVHHEDEFVLEGSGSLGAGGDMAYTTLFLPATSSLIGRRVQITVWQRPDGTRVIPSLSWYGGDDNDPMYLAGITFQPTGRATSDGWEEWTSGPFDWAWAEAIEPYNIDFVDEQLNAYYGGAFPDDDARSYLDAFEVVDLGPALVSAAACSLVTEVTTCGESGLCQMGRCVDAAGLVGQPILNDALRADYVDRRLFEVDLFEGGRAPQSRFDLVAARLLPLKDHAVASTFWPTFAEAYTLLIDGHASAPMMAYPSFNNAGVCVHEGEADLLPGSPVVPLVFQTTDNVVGGLLQPGDALVAIDGVPTAEWSLAAARLVQHPGDPEGRSVVTAPSLMIAAIDSGAVLTFQRCTPAVAGTPCSASEVENIVVDLAAIVGDAVRAGQSPIGYGDYAECDYRFIRPVPDNAVSNTAYEFAGHTDVDGVRTLVINGVPGEYDQGGSEWFAEIADAMSGDPAAMILDERTGNGGGIDAMDWIGASLLGRDDLYAMDFLPALDDDALGPPRDEIVTCSTQSRGDYGCGNGFRWGLGDRAGGNTGKAAGTKLAVIIASDVSGNDYLTKMLRRRTGNETRVFGAGSTWGAFGVIWSIAGHGMGELAGGSMQVQDTIFMDSSGDTSEVFSTSTGERPDEVVRQTQSDALLGKDTVLEAARAWLVGGAP